MSLDDRPMAFRGGYCLDLFIVASNASHRYSIVLKELVALRANPLSHHRDQHSLKLAFPRAHHFGFPQWGGILAWSPLPSRKFCRKVRIERRRSSIVTATHDLGYVCDLHRFSWRSDAAINFAPLPDRFGIESGILGHRGGRRGPACHAQNPENKYFRSSALGDRHQHRLTAEHPRNEPKSFTENP